MVLKLLELTTFDLKDLETIQNGHYEVQMFSGFGGSLFGERHRRFASRLEALGGLSEEPGHLLAEGLRQWLEAFVRLPSLELSWLLEAIGRKEV